MPEINAAPDAQTTTNESIESLRDHHQQLEQRLDKLGGQRSLSPEEKFEMQVLKKRKLALKDRIRARDGD